MGEATAYSDFNHRWSRRREHGYGDHLLLSQAEQNGGIWCTLCPPCQHDSCDAWCSGADKEIHQYSLHSLMVPLAAPQPWCQYSLSEVHLLSSSLWPTVCTYKGYLQYLKTEVLLPCEEGENGDWCISLTPERFYGKGPNQGHWLSDPVSLSIPSSTPHPLIEEGIQPLRKDWAARNLATTQPLQWLQNYNHERALARM